MSYEWKQDKEKGERYIEATMQPLVDEIIMKYHQVMGREPEEYSTPGKPNEHLKKGAEEEECLKTKNTGI